MSTPRQAALEAKRALAKAARPASAFDPTRYFRSTEGLAFHNVGMTAVRTMAKTIDAAHRGHWTTADALAFADILVRDRHLETKEVGIALLARHRRQFVPTMLPTWRQWLKDGYASNWATTDSMCGSLIGPLLVANPELAPRLRTWTRDSNLWVRRAAAVGLVALARRGEALDLAYDVASRLHGDGEDLIQKAVGWLLREAGKTDMARLERYLRSRGPGIPRTSLRYAIERFPAARRRALLQATRSAL